MELSIVQFFQSLWQGTFFDTMMWAVSARGFLVLLRIIALGLALWKHKRQWKLIVICFALAGLLFYGVSEFFFKDILVHFTWINVRPYLAHPDLIHAIWTSYSDSSFPSSHMASTLAMLTVMVYFWKKTWVYALIIAVLMAVSRMHNGMHYPSDVLVGALVGILCGIGAVCFGKMIWTKIKK